MSDLLAFLAFLCALGSGLMAGVFFAFSTFVTQGLRDLVPAEGIKTMNAINVRAVTPMFMSLLFGTGFLCLAVIVMSSSRWAYRETPLIIGGATLYLIGAVVVTVLRNVPLNNALAAANAADAAGIQLWATYLRDWRGWNHVRTICCTVACAIMIAGLVESAEHAYGDRSIVRDVTLGVYFLTAVGSGLVGGVFFAFSTFVMRGLKDLPPVVGIKAMNAINVRAVTPVFMTLLFGTGLLCLLAMILSFWRPHAYTAQLASVLYVVGALVVTMVRNVPLNKALAIGGTADATAAQLWTTYMRAWTNWNHVRTAGCALGYALFIAAVFRMNYIIYMPLIPISQ